MCVVHVVQVLCLALIYLVCICYINIETRHQELGHVSRYKTIGTLS